MLLFCMLSCRVYYIVQVRLFTMNGSHSYFELSNKTAYPNSLRDKDESE